MSQADSLFKYDFKQKLNLNDIKDMVSMENALYKDPLFK